MRTMQDNAAKAEVWPIENPLGYSIKDLTSNGPLSRTQIYEALKDGLLKAKKAGRRTIITPEAWADYLNRLPDYPAAA